MTDPRLVALVALLAVAPPVAASGTLATTVIVFSVDNGHDSDCLETETGLCLASYEGEGGELEVDADQQVRFVRIAANDTTWRATPVYYLVPDGSITLRREMLEAPNPISPALAHHVGRVQLPAPLEAFAIYFDEQEYGLDYVGPRPLELDLTPQQHHHAYRYSSDGGVEYDEVGPSRDYLDAATDDAPVLVRDICSEPGLDACTQSASAGSAAYAALTPNVTLGLELHELAAGTNASALAASAAIDRTSLMSTASAPSRVMPAAPLLPRPDIAPHGVLTHGGSAAGGLGDTTPPPATARHVQTRSSANAAHTPARAAPPVALAAVSFALAVLTTAALYSRFHREQALQHATRKRILDLVEKNGPTSYADIGRAIGADRTTIDFHVRLLQKTGFVTTARGGRMVFVLLPGQDIDPALRRGDAELAEALIQILREHGGKMPRGALHDAAPAFSQRARNGAIGRLLRAGTIERAFEGNVEVVRFTARAMAAH